MEKLNEDHQPINSTQNHNIFKKYGVIEFGGIDNVFHVEGIGFGLANESGIFFDRGRKKIKTILELKEYFFKSTGKILQEKNIEPNINVKLKNKCSNERKFGRLS